MKKKGIIPIPWGNKIQLDFPTTSVGGLQVETGSSIQEIATVIAIGPEVIRYTDLHEGDRLLIKTWDVDVITYEDQKFYFISEDSRAICGIAVDA